MTSRTLVPLFLTTLLSLTGCSSRSAEDLVQAQITLVEDIGVLLTMITDVTSADIHRQELIALVDEMSALRGHIMALPDAKEAEGRALMQEHGPALQAALARMQTELRRIRADDRLRPRLAEALSGLGT